MGLGGVALRGSDYSAFYNPARLSNDEGLVVSVAKSGPYYLDDGAKYRHLYLSYASNKYGAIGLSSYRYSSDLTFLTQRVRHANYALTYSKEIYQGYSMGMNLNFFKTDTDYSGSSHTNTMDIGIYKRFDLPLCAFCSHDLVFASCIKNLTRSAIRLHSSNEGDPSFLEALPSVLTVGSSYRVQMLKMRTPSSRHLLGVLVHAEYTDLLNASHRTGFKTGAELSAFEFLNLRLGYYRLSGPEIYSNAKDFIEDFTYGAGIDIKIPDLLAVNFPLELSFDYARMPQATHVTNFDAWDDFTSYSLTLRYNIETAGR
jgi:hypothetical protein